MIYCVQILQGLAALMASAAAVWLMRGARSDRCAVSHARPLVVAMANERYYSAMFLVAVSLFLLLANVLNLFLASEPTRTNSAVLALWILNGTFIRVLVLVNAYYKVRFRQHLNLELE